MSENPTPVVAETQPQPQAIEKAPVKRSEVVHFDSNDPSSLFMVTSVFEQLQRVATLMSKSQLVPKHLQGEVSDCFLVASQAFQWKMNPFAVAQSCYVLSGKVGYEGKLIAAIVNASPNLKTKLNYEYSGSGAQRQVRVFGTLKGEDKPREVIGTVASWQTTNKQWSTQTDQMLSYRGAREWARRHMPETILGVYAEEELPALVQSATVTVAPASLDEFVGDVVSASDDPKSVIIDVEGKVVKEEKPKREAKKVEKKEPAPAPAPAPTPAPDADDAALDALFSK